MLVRLENVGLDSSRAFRVYVHGSGKAAIRASSLLGNNTGQLGGGRISVPIVVLRFHEGDGGAVNEKVGGGRI